jgi:hypothetical protein
MKTYTFQDITPRNALKHSSKESYRMCIKDYVTEIRGQGPVRAVELLEKKCVENQHTHHSSWSWALRKKPPILQILKNFPAFYETRGFITMVTRALHWPLSWARSIHSPISLRSILILCTHLHLGLSIGFLPSGFPTNTLYAFLFSPFVLQRYHSSIRKSVNFF